MHSEPKGTRDYCNIIGDMTIPMTMASLGEPFGFGGAVATDAADVLSSEIGVLLNPSPRMITNLREKVVPGTSGGVSPEGTIIGGIAAFIVSIVSHFAIFSLAANFPKICFMVTLSRVWGNLLDSVFGATIERSGFLDNTDVNILGTLSGALFTVPYSHVYGLRSLAVQPQGFSTTESQKELGSRLSLF